MDEEARELWWVWYGGWDHGRQPLRGVKPAGLRPGCPLSLALPSSVSPLGEPLSRPGTTGTAMAAQGALPAPPVPPLPCPAWPRVAGTEVGAAEGSGMEVGIARVVGQRWGPQRVAGWRWGPVAACCQTGIPLLAAGSQGRGHVCGGCPPHRGAQVSFRAPVPGGGTAWWCGPGCCPAGRAGCVGPIRHGGNGRPVCGLCQHHGGGSCKVMLPA